MRGVLRWVVAVVVVLHGMIHFLGAATGSSWAYVSQLGGLDLGGAPMVEGDAPILVRRRTCG